MGKPDVITRRLDLNKGEANNKNVVMLKPEHFRRLAIQATEVQTQSFTSIYKRIQKAAGLRDKLVEWELAAKSKDWEEHEDGVVEWKGTIYVLKHSHLWEDLLMMYHDSLLAGHLGQHKRLLVAWNFSGRQEVCGRLCIVSAIQTAP